MSDIETNPSEMIVSELNGREDLIQLTASIGQTLLLKNNELEEQIQNLQSQLSQRDEYINQLQLDHNSTIKKIHVYQFRIKDLKEQLSSVQTNFDNYRTTQNDSESQIIKLLEDLKISEIRIKKLTSELTDNHQQREQLFDRIFQLETDNQNLQTQLEKSSTRERELKKASQAISIERDSVQASLVTTNDKIHDLERRLSTFQQSLQTSQSQLQEMHSLQSRNDSLLLENEKLANMLETCKVNSKRQRDEYERILDDLRVTSQEPLLVRKESIKSGMKVSIFDEISKEIEKEVAEKGKVPLPSENMSPSEIYFFLTVCSAKIRLAFKQEQDYFAEVKKTQYTPLDIKRLYDEITKLDIPFHEWPRWVKKRLTEEAYNQVVSVSSNSILGGSLPMPKVNRHPTVFNVGGTKSEVNVVRKIKS